MAVREVMARSGRAIGRHGFGGVARIATDRIVDRLYLEEQHVWYELALDGRPCTAPLPEGMRLVAVSEAELPVAAAMGRRPDEARAWFAAGHELWMVIDGQVPLFSTWVFKGRTPALAARGGWLPLPDGTACVEDTVTDASCRGRGIAPAALGNVATSLHERGVRALIAKIEVGNASSRRTAAKLGFAEIGLMRLKRVGPHYNVRVDEPGGLTGPFLARALERQGR